jgi:aspartate aminotransferase
MRDRTVLCGSASKTYAMTGWRCGWTIAPKKVIDACNDVQGHSTSNVSSITQRAVVAALNGPQECVKEMLTEYRRRRDLVLDLVTKSGRMACQKPSGAFYLFVDVTKALTPAVPTSMAFAQGLLDEARVVVTAGEGFEAPGFLRMSYATSEQQLREGVARIERFIETIGKGVVPASARS